jgi:endonuclease/exonuclease/phosphatase (EEP) superfamily protein YafD
MIKSNKNLKSGSQKSNVSLAVIALSVLLATQNVLARSSSAGQVLARQKCNFLCQEIPEPNEVLESWSSPSENALLNPVVKALGWNIYKGRKSDFSSSFLNLAKGKDIVMLSEGTDGDLVKPDTEKLEGFGWDMGISFFMKDNVGTGIITGSYAKTTFVDYRKTPDLEPFVKSPKIILLTKYFHASTGKEILFINIHGINWKSTDAFKRQLLSIEDAVNNHNGPVLFAGDFNIRNAERLSIAKQVLGAMGLQRVPWSNPNTKKQLDDAFTRGFKVQKAYFHNEVIDQGSDHPAMELELIPN